VLLLLHHLDLTLATHLFESVFELPSKWALHIVKQSSVLAKVWAVRTQVRFQLTAVPPPTDFLFENQPQEPGWMHAGDLR
jgi:hypothetical protein